MKVTRVALQQRATVFFVMAAAVILGFMAYRNLPREAFPDVQIPIVTVYTLYPGASPGDIESQITDLVERELQGVEDLKEIRSTSQESASMIEVEFESGTDIDDALQKVRDRVDRAEADFPEDAEDAILQEINFSDIPVLQVNLSGNVGPVVLKDLAKELQDRLEAIPGVLKVSVVGGLEREVKVEVDPERLRLYGLSLNDVVDAVRSENVAIPGGEFDLGERTYAVTIPGEATDPLQVADFVISSPGGSPIFVRDVAQVIYGFKDRTSYARVDGKESVALTIQKRQGANVVDVADTAREVVAQTKAGWGPGISVSFLGDQSKEVRMIVKDLENNILSGLVLVILVLMFALGLRNALFVGIAIPISMLVTFLIIQISGMSLNNVVLFAMVLAVGMLVDNAVVVIENIYRHLQQGKSRFEAARVGTEEVGAAIAVSTFTTVAAFAPLLFWPGVVGDFMSYMPLTVSIVLMVSLVVAVTMNPVLCRTFMILGKHDRGVMIRPGSIDADPADDRAADGAEDSGEVDERPPPSRALRFGNRVLSVYDRLLNAALDRRWMVIAATIVVFVGVVMLFGAFNHGVEFFPETEPPQIFVDVDLDPGARLEKTDQVVLELERRLKDTADLEIMAASLGAGAQNDFGSSGVGGATQARIVLDLFDRDDREQNSFDTMEWVREQTSGLPGVTIDVNRLDDGPPTGEPLEVEFSGEDFETLGMIAERARRALSEIPDLVSLDSDFDLARPELVVDIDRTQAARLGLTTADIATTIRTAITGTDASTFRQADEDEEVDITVRLAEDARRDLETLSQLTAVTEDGVQIPLGSIASLRQASALTSIRHKDRERVVTVRGGVTSPELAEPVRAEARRRLEAVPDLLPDGYTMTFSGQSEDEAEAQAFLSRAFLYAIILVLALMVGKFNSLTIPLIIITSVIMSMVGVLVGLLVTGLPFGIIMTGLGVISLAGIVVNNAIVLLDYGEQLWARETMLRREVVVQTGLRRLRPVVLTAVTTILGLIPLTSGYEFDFHRFVFAAGGESSQWWKTMGAAVIFGLAFATFLTLILVPVLYDLLLQWRERHDPLRRQRIEERSHRSEPAEIDSEAVDRSDELDLAEGEPAGSPG